MGGILNLEWYDSTVEYSDGPIEVEILHGLEDGMTESEMLKQDDRWPIIYHFSPQRRNLLQWIDFPKDSDVLEIGSGMGALTSILCEKAGHVTCVELSLLRSRINERRNAARKNLEIVVANLNDIPFYRAFDIVTLVGVLEYSGRYTSGNEPYRDFLIKASSLVKPGGMMILAIENRLGLKYFAGSKEDHIGKPFVGLDGYPDEQGIRTFSLAEIEVLLLSAGLVHNELYLPFPDYKFPEKIVVADEVGFHKEALASEPNYGGYELSSFDQVRVGLDLASRGILREFANSFLILAYC